LGPFVLKSRTSSRPTFISKNSTSATVSTILIIFQAHKAKWDKMYEKARKQDVCHPVVVVPCHLIIKEELLVLPYPPNWYFLWRSYIISPSQQVGPICLSSELVSPITVIYDLLLTVGGSHMKIKNKKSIGSFKLIDWSF
jgi:hypothetical protein